MSRFTEEDDALLDELGVEVAVKQDGVCSPREERIIAGFEDIQRFYDQHKRPPQHGEERDIFERIYAVRLDRLREMVECRALLQPIDHQGLLAGFEVPSTAAESIDDDELLAQLGVGEDRPAIMELKHVRPLIEIQAAEEVANRVRCQDFAEFKPLFDKVQQELESGVRKTRPFEVRAEIRPGAWFILRGQKTYVAEMGELISTDHGKDARLRVIFDNGTESDMLMRSLQRALNKDEAGRRITDPVAGPLFAGNLEPDDMASGTIYVLRSKSDLPLVAANRDLVHKIGVTSQKVEQRISNASLQPTFLMADVDVVATYELFNINRTRLEYLIHKVFDTAKLDIEVKDRFGNPVVPHEWFLVPIFVIDEAVARIKDGTITGYIYDPKQARLVPITK